MERFAPWFERVTDERAARALRERRSRFEQDWNNVLAACFTCSKVLMALEAAETVLEQNPPSNDDPLWSAAQKSALRAMTKARQQSDAYLKLAPLARLLWTRETLKKSLHSCQRKLCRPKAELDYHDVGGEMIPVCGAMEPLLKAGELPSIEEIYEGQAGDWNPEKYRQGGEDAAPNDW